MKIGFAIPIVGPAVSTAVGLSAFCRGLEELGYDTLWVGDRLVTPVDMHSTYPGKEQPYPPQMTRYLDPVLLWTVAATVTSRWPTRSKASPRAVLMRRSLMPSQCSPALRSCSTSPAR
jgi:hypothetical protein